MSSLNLITKISENIFNEISKAYVLNRVDSSLNNINYYCILENYYFSSLNNIELTESSFIKETDIYLFVGFYDKFYIFSKENGCIKLAFEYEYPLNGIVLFDDRLIIITDGGLMRFECSENIYLIDYKVTISEGGLIVDYKIKDNILELIHEEGSITTHLI